MHLLYIIKANLLLKANIIRNILNRMFRRLSYKRLARVVLKNSYNKKHNTSFKD